MLGMILLPAVAFLLDERHDRLIPGAPPSGAHLPSHPLSTAEPWKLESGEQRRLRGAVFANQRIHLDLTLKPGSVCDLYFHEREREVGELAGLLSAGDGVRPRHTVRLSANRHVANGFVAKDKLGAGGTSVSLTPGVRTAVTVQSRYGIHALSIDDAEIDQLDDSNIEWGGTGVSCISGGALVHSLTVVPLPTEIRGPLSIGRIVRRSSVVGGLLLVWFMGITWLGREKVVRGAVNVAIAAAAALAGAGFVGAFFEAGTIFVEIALVGASVLLTGFCLFERGRLRFASLVMGLNLALVLTAAEGVMRARGPSSTMLDFHRWATIENPATLWKLVPGSGIGNRYINTLGCRGEELEVEAEGNGYRVVCVGGSSCFGEAIDAPSATYPGELERLLSRNDEFDFEVLNAGVPGYTSYQTLKRMRAELEKLSPDLVVVSHAQEDGSPARSFPDHELSARLDTRWRSILHRFARGVRRSELWRAIGRGIELGAKASLPDSTHARVPLDRFESNLLALDSLADSLDFELLYVVEPQHDFHSTKPERSAYHEATRNVAKETERGLVDMLAVFRRHRHDLLFRGAVQQSERGASLMAEAVYGALREHLPELSGLEPVAKLKPRTPTARQVKTPRHRQPEPRPARDPNRARLDAFADRCIELGRTMPREAELRRRIDEAVLGGIALPEDRLAPAVSFLAHAGSALARNDRRAAIDAFRKAVNVAPDLAVAQNLLAGELIASAEFGAARAVIAAGIAAAPGSVPLHLQHARLAFRQGRTREALHATDAVLALDPGSAEALFLSGQAHLRTGDSKGATERWERLLEVAPKSPEADRARGLLGREG